MSRLNSLPSLAWDLSADTWRALCRKLPSKKREVQLRWERNEYAGKLAVAELTLRDYQRHHDRLRESYDRVLVMLDGVTVVGNERYKQVEDLQGKLKVRDQLIARATFDLAEKNRELMALRKAVNNYHE